MEDSLLIVGENKKVFIFIVSSKNRYIKYKKCVHSLMYNDVKV